MEFENIIYTKEKEKGIARVIINRPAVRNAFNRTTRIELKQAVEDIERDKDIRVAIITGAGGKAFVAGADIGELKQHTPLTIEEQISTIGQRLYTDIENARVPFIAMISGFCLGGGCELAMCCDIRIASENSRFGLPEILIGIFPGSGGTQRLPKIIGWGRAKELMYTGRMIDAAEAERWGLVNRVVPVDKLEETVNQLAEEIASKSPVAINLLKKTINQAMYTDLAAGLACERGNFSLLFTTEDHIEGMEAFLEKRKPEFKGK